jgi:hypothetical protein
MTKRAYAGVGSRETPPEILSMMTAASMQLEEAGLILRSGGAEGADHAFECGCWHNPDKQIFLPWNGFNNRYIREPGCYRLEEPYLGAARKIAADHHPAWDKLSYGAEGCMIRNSAQVLGPKLDDPSLFVLCWTPGGKGGGGTGQAIRVATTYGIPVFDMGKMDLDTIAQAISKILEIL